MAIESNTSLAMGEVKAAQKSHYASGETPRRGDQVEGDGFTGKVFSLDHARELAKVYDGKTVRDFRFSDLSLVERG